MLLDIAKHKGIDVGEATLLQFSYKNGLGIAFFKSFGATLHTLTDNNCHWAL